MSQLVKLEKRFENALEKLELALASNNVREVPDGIYKKKEVAGESHNNIGDLLIKIERLEEAAKKDAAEIDKLVSKLKELLEADND